MVSRLSRRTRAAQGFSLIELLIAVMFTAILMAGLASVFRSSVTSFTTSGELLSANRRNRGSIDLLTDDIHAAAMYLGDLSIAPTVGPNNPAFYVLPNLPIPEAGANDPASADQLFVYLDDPLPFEAALPKASVVAAKASLSDLVSEGKDVAASDQTYVLDCKSADYAKQVKDGQEFVFKDAFQRVRIDKVVSVAGSLATVQLGARKVGGGTGPSAPAEVSLAMITGNGFDSPAAKDKHLPESGIVAYRPGQMIRYSVEMLSLDPKGTKIPCLVRDQGTYDTAGFVPDPNLRQLISEHVSGFKVFLSTNSGKEWAGLDTTTQKPKTYGTAPAPPKATASADEWTAFRTKMATYFQAAWVSGMRNEIDTQLKTSGRPGFNTTAVSEHWFRMIPTLVRVDLTSRTATQRPEYSANGKTPVYKDTMQSLVVVPRHFGLPMEL